MRGLTACARRTSAGPRSSGASLALAAGRRGAARGTAPAPLAAAFAGEDAGAAQDVVADADEAVRLGPERIRLVKALHDPDDRVVGHVGLADLGDLADGAQRLPE